jgi:hypothetical protein
MSRIHPECRDADPFDPAAAADALFRREPDEADDDEEDEDEDDRKEDDDDDEEAGEGYSERACRHFLLWVKDEA